MVVNKHHGLVFPVRSLRVSSFFVKSPFAYDDDDTEETSKQDEITSGDEIINRGLLH